MPRLSKLRTLAAQLQKGEIKEEDVPASVRGRVVRAVQQHTREQLLGTTPDPKDLPGAARNRDRIANVISN